MLEVEGRAIHLLEDIGTALADNGYGHVWQALNNGCVEITPNTGPPSQTLNSHPNPTVSSVWKSS
jgi:hypothetical protein